MVKNRFFIALITAAFVIAVAITVQEVAATAGILSQPDSKMSAETLDCFDLPSRYSLHTVDMEETGMRVTYTEDGPTGVDGGLKELMTAYRTCSK